MVIGPIFEESATRFFLVSNFKRKVFHYFARDLSALPTNPSRARRFLRWLLRSRAPLAIARAALPAIVPLPQRLTMMFEPQCPDRVRLRLNARVHVQFCR
jgi:hypothetical protein